DSLDLFLIYGPLSGTTKRLETWRAFLDAKTAGKLKTVRVSNHNVHHLEQIRQTGLETPSVNQIELHPFCQQKPIVEYCNAHNIFMQAYCPLIRDKNFDNPVLVEVSKKCNKDMAQILVRWSLQRGYASAFSLDPLPKSSRLARIISNAALYEFEISPEDMAKLDALDRGEAGVISWNPINGP
ncbi:NADP-dependent oxidoreductase domain-containing protein, partial [Sparassis latifolia]